MNKKWYAQPYILWSILFVVVPLLLVVYFGFTTKTADGSMVFSLENFQKFFTPAYLEVFLRSLWYAFISTVVCLLLGYPAAMVLSNRNLKSQGTMVLLLVIPMWMNLLLRTYAWLTLLENEGLINQFLRFIHVLGEGESIQFLYHDGAVVFGMVYNFLPFMILPIYSVMTKLDQSVVEAAEDLGANWWHVFRRVRLPLSIPGVMSGITMVFVPAVTTFAISAILGGNKVTLLGNLIERQFGQMNNWNFGSAISLVLMVIILLSMGFMSSYEKENEGGGLL